MYITAKTIFVFIHSFVWKKSFVSNFYRRRKEREEISASGVIEVWGLSPREAPPEYVQCSSFTLYTCVTLWFNFSRHLGNLTSFPGLGNKKKIMLFHWNFIQENRQNWFSLLPVWSCTLRLTLEWVNNLIVTDNF